MEYNIKKLVELGLLKRIPASRDSADNGMKTAHTWLKEADENLRARTFRSCLLGAYLAMFHAARARLFADGFRERSHFAVARYLEAQYVKKGLLEEKWVQLIDHYRELRHEGQYGTVFMADEEEARASLDAAKQFVERMVRLLE